MQRVNRRKISAEERGARSALDRKIAGVVTRCILLLNQSGHTPAQITDAYPIMTRASGDAILKMAYSVCDIDPATDFPTATSIEERIDVVALAYEMYRAVVEGARGVR